MVRRGPGAGRPSSLKVRIVPAAVACISICMLVPVPAGGQSGRSESLGEVRFEISCPEPAQRRFDHAVALLHHMTYARARAEFLSIASDYPKCAMAHWGAAMTLFQPLWPTRPTEEDLRRGWLEVSAARRIGGGTPRETMFIASAAAFFDPTAGEYLGAHRSVGRRHESPVRGFPPGPRSGDVLRALTAGHGSAVGRSHPPGEGRRGPEGGAAGSPHASRSDALHDPRQRCATGGTTSPWMRRGAMRR